MVGKLGNFCQKTGYFRKRGKVYFLSGSPEFGPKDVCICGGYLFDGLNPHNAQSVFSLVPPRKVLSMKLVSPNSERGK